MDPSTLDPALTISALLPVSVKEEPFLLDPRLSLPHPSSVETNQFNQSAAFQIKVEEHQLQIGVKRKYEAETPERNVKIKEALEKNEMNFSQPLTTVTCLHASVAQKSYGKEKRYLSPPPLVTLNGPMKDLIEKPSLMLSVISEAGERGGHQKSRIGEPNMEAYFQSLHVQATTKAKSFSLQLTLHPPTVRKAAATVEEAQAMLLFPFAAFDSAPIPIISKPSKKTAKTRNMTSCILNGSTISLFSRINSQTARTKFMAVDDGRLSAKTYQWVAFRIDVIRSSDYNLQRSLEFGDKRPVLYGSEITLTDILTGTVSEILIIRKVEKGFLALDATGPVSQLQKLAFARKLSDEESIYLSVRPDGMDMYGNQVADAQVTIDPKSRKASKSKAKSLLENAGMGIDAEYEEALYLTYSHPAIETAGETHELDDFTCWTVTGINSFSFSFFNAFSAELGIPTAPITPFPTIASEPQYRPQTHCLELPLSNYFYDIPGTNQAAPLELWLGSIGPLTTRVIVTGATSADVTRQDDTSVEGIDYTDEPIVAVGTLLSVQLPPLGEIIEKAEIKANLAKAAKASSYFEPEEDAAASGSNQYAEEEVAEEEETYNYVFEDIALMVAKIHEADEPNDLENVDGQEWNTADDYTAESNYSIQQNPTGLSGIARVLAEQDAREQEDALRAFEENSRLVTEPVLGLDLMVVRPFDGITYLTNWKVVIDEDGNLSLYKTPSLC